MVVQWRREEGGESRDLECIMLAPTAGQQALRQELDICHPVYTSQELYEGSFIAPLTFSQIKRLMFREAEEAIHSK